jgi:4-amino-4-deoxy-L-arabinose transferase-like glycosyltransferase
MQATVWHRRDTVAILALTIASALIRVWRVTALGLDHFDAGGYALSSRAIFVDAVPEGLHPLQHQLSPPFYFGLSGAVMRVVGAATDFVPIAVSLAFGVLTIPLVYLIARRWLGYRAAMASAILLALSEFHILYSRAALTDSTFIFFFLLALFLFSETYRRQSLALSLLAGAATGLAWNTKYHGWLAIVVAAAALVPVARRSGRARLRGDLTRLAAAGAVASLTYLPWAIFIQTQEGGYAQLAAHHASYLRPGDLVQHIAHHLRSQLFIEAWLSGLAPFAAAAAVVLVSRGPARVNMGRATILGLTMLAAGLVWGSAVTGGILALAGVGMLARRADYGGWVLIMFFAFFSLLTPLYAPYSRLLFPWLCAAFLLAGSAIDGLFCRLGSLEAPAWRWRHSLASTAFAAALALTLYNMPDYRGRGAPYSSSDGFRSAAADVPALLPGDADVAVIGEPAVVFYLLNRGYDCLHLNRPDQLYENYRAGDTVFVILGHYGRLTGQFERWSRDHEESVEQVGSVSVEVSDVRLLDDFRPARIVEYRAASSGVYDLQVFRTILPKKE